MFFLCQALFLYRDKDPTLFIDVRGWGLINGIEINEEMSITSIDIVKAAMDEGLLLAPAGPKVLRFVPPLIVTEEEINEAAEKLETAISKVCAAAVN